MDAIAGNWTVAGGWWLQGACFEVGGQCSAMPPAFWPTRLGCARSRHACGAEQRSPSQLPGGSHPCTPTQLGCTRHKTNRQVTEHHSMKLLLNQARVIDELESTMPR